MNERSPRSSVEAPALGCAVGGCLVPGLWLIVSALALGSGSSGWAGLPIASILLALVGLICGLLYNSWKNRNGALSDAALTAELQSMSMESLLEYQSLCPTDSREYSFAETELARRRAKANDRNA